MTTIHIAASREYDVVIEPGLLTRLGTMAAELGLEIGRASCRERV